MSSDVGSERQPTPAPDVDQRLLVAFMGQMTVNAWVKGADGRYLLLSPLTQQTFAPGRNILGLTDFQVFDPAVASVLREHDQLVIATDQPQVTVEEVPDANGDVRCWYSVKFPLRLGAEVHIGGVAVDITAYARLEREKRQTQQKLHQILDAITDLIFVKGPESRLEWANKAFCDAYGISSEQLQGILDSVVNPPDFASGYVRDDGAVWDSGRALDIPEEPLTRADGKVMICHTVESPIFDDAGTVINIVGVSRDITESKRLEMELRQAQKLESVGRLASGIAHEINTPIQFVGDQNRFTGEAMGELLALVARYRAFAGAVAATGGFVAERAALQAADEEADLPYLEEALPRAFAAITEGVSRVAKLVAAMKEFGHPDRGAPGYADINRALGTTITIAANELRPVADVKTVFADLPPVRCLIGDLNQVFLNLLVNAAHAIADAGRAALGTITVTTTVAGDMVTVSIADDGTGIAAEAQRKIFEPFFTTKEVGRGTGQGLAIARMVVEKHQGTLTFETEPGRGTTFHVRIPVHGPSAPV